MPVLEKTRITKVQREEGSPWGRIFTDHPEVKRLDTQHDEKLREAARLMTEGVPLDIEYTAQASKNINPHTQRPYENRYYESAIPSRGAGVADDGIEVVPAVGRTMPTSDAWRICLGAGAKLAVMTLPLMPTEQRDFETQKRIAMAWALWIFHTSAHTPMAGEDPSIEFGSTASGANSPGAYLDPLARPDDDIPYAPTIDGFA